MSNQKTRILLRGMRDGIPIGLGYFAVSFSLGVIAGKAGLSAIQGFITSFFVRASAGEYSGYTMIAQAATYAELILMCLIANARYLLMGFAMTQKFRKTEPLYKRILVACCITDEIFGISIAYPGELHTSYTFGAFLVSSPLWALGTALGIIAGQILPMRGVSALSVALYGMFLAIIVPPAKKNLAVAISVVISFALSYVCTFAPWIKDLSAGTRTILLTVLIAAVFALICPVKDEPDTAAPTSDAQNTNEKEALPHE